MPAVDYERVLVKLKARLTEKPSWSKDQVRVLIAELEVECEIPEDQEGFDGTPRRPRALPREHVPQREPTPDERPAQAVA